MTFERPATAVALGTPGIGNLRGDESFPRAARRALADTQMRHNVGHATRSIRTKRLAAVQECDDWEELRQAGSAIKRDVLGRLPELLEQLERNVTGRGGVVHWARDADEANHIVADLIRATGAAEVVKVKSMATQEIGLNEYLADRGISAVETDLAELIVQLAGDWPSHILVPAIHKNRSEIRDVFRREMPGTEDLSDDPHMLAMAARSYLRRKFLSARVAVSGANFGVAETGTLAVVESEGNGRMCLTLPQTLITVMGIEKVIPRFADLEVFMQLLPRSSTAERMNPYTSMWTGVHDGDGPQKFHLVLLDNGRTRVLADPVGRAALQCIRCSACLNVCPVYERTGGHAYGSVYPGPIGAILSPQLTGTDGHHDPNASLPFASSLCGACFDACPVLIDIPSILVHLRAEHIDSQRGGIPRGQDLAMTAAAWVMGSPRRFALAERAAGLGRLVAGSDHRITALPWPASKWTASRDLPAPPRETFRQWWARTHEATS
jgi:L-lactate dehydrogenase complex protein LldF